jgi:hypothetical protein
MPHITQEELVEINKLRDKLATVVSEAGQRTLQVQLLQEDISRLNTQLGEDSKVFKKLLEDEQALIKRLSDKYGVGDINFETGEFTPEK